MLILCFSLHFVADFLMQSREMGQKKSSEVKWLLKHLGIQFGVFFVGLTLFVGPTLALGYAVLNALIHGLIDWHIWRLYKAWTHYRLNKGIGTPKEIKEWQDNEEFHYWDDHWFYTTIGLDQFLHGVTLIILAGLLF